MLMKSVKLTLAALGLGLMIAASAGTSFAASAGQSKGSTQNSSHQVPDWAVGIDSYQ
jgi:ABC-type glycerol-3-phosphate transport system substrate-binding protein